MEWTAVFFLNSILLGIGLAMDAFSVSLADGLGEPEMSKRKMNAIAGVFAFYQILMPLGGWICVHAVYEAFSGFQKFIPWIALALLGWIGGKMLLDGIRKKGGEDGAPAVSFWALMVQGIATSIDALSVGFTIADLGFAAALTECLIIGAATYAICIVGILLGRRFGTRLADKASVLGGVILIGIGLEIFISGMFF